MWPASEHMLILPFIDSFFFLNEKKETSQRLQNIQRTMKIKNLLKYVIPPEKISRPFVFPLKIELMF